MSRLDALATIGDINLYQSDILIPDRNINIRIAGAIFDRVFDYIDKTSVISSWLP